MVDWQNIATGYSISEGDFLALFADLPIETFGDPADPRDHPKDMRDAALARPEGQSGRIEAD
jgi:hypothetical protein